MGYGALSCSERERERLQKANTFNLFRSTFTFTLNNHNLSNQFFFYFSLIWFEGPFIFYHLIVLESGYSWLVEPLNSCALHCIVVSGVQLCTASKPTSHFMIMVLLQLMMMMLGVVCTASQPCHALMREGKEAKQGQLRICILLQSHHSNPHPCFSIYLIIINSQNNIIFFPSLFKFLCPFFPFLLTLLLHIPVIHAFTMYFHLDSV